MPIFDACFEAGVTYLDMAMSLSRPHPERPHELTGEKLGDAQFAAAADWEARGLLALVGIGVEPGLSDVFARYAQDELFSEIHEAGVRDGANLTVDGYEFAPSFSIWTTIEECLNPPVIWEDGRWFTTPPFSEPEVFDFPEGIGPVECVNVEHEEVLLIPRWVKARRVTFKYGLGNEFIEVLRTLHKLGLDSTTPVRVKGVEVSPRDVVAACLPDPAGLGDRMHGKTCAGTWVTGLGKDGQPRQVYLYHVVDNATTMAEYGSQAVVWQTAINPIVALGAARARDVERRRRAGARGVRADAVPRPARRVRVAMGHARGDAALGPASAPPSHRPRNVQRSNRSAPAPADRPAFRWGLTVAGGTPALHPAAQRADWNGSASGGAPGA